MEKEKKGFGGFVQRNWLVILTGLLVGAAAVVLTALGNPKNMGFCIACFERDIAGALKFHSIHMASTVFFCPKACPPATRSP